MKYKSLIIKAILIIAILLSIALIYSRLNPYQSKSITVAKGMTSQEIAELLEKEGMIHSGKYFYILSMIKRVQGKLQAGRYHINNRMSTWHILDKIVKGDIEGIKVTIPEGYTALQIASLIQSKGLGNASLFMEYVNENNLEGYLFPSTYTIYTPSTEKEIADLIIRYFYKIFNNDLLKRAQETGFTEKEIVILASIIEKEARVDNERTVISSVFHNRLKKKWMLESCATVQYAIGEHKLILTYRDLEINSPYNTYLNRGLPPGPICNPGEASLKAALYPDDSDVLFFIANGDGTHRFSRYLSEHNRKKIKIKGS